MHYGGAHETEIDLEKRADGLCLSGFMLGLFYLAGRKRKDEEVVFAGRNDGEEAAIGRDGEIAIS